MKLKLLETCRIVEKIVEIFQYKRLADFLKGITAINPFFIVGTYRNCILIKLDHLGYFPLLSDNVGA